MRKTLFYTAFYIMTSSSLFAQTDTIHVTNYTAAQQGAQVKLTWQTTIEKNVQLFTVERGLDTVNYQDIVHIKPAGNSSSTTNYQFTDLHNLSNDCYFYRLTGIYYGGKIASSDVLKLCYKSVSIDELMIKRSYFNIYFNLTSNCISILPPGLSHHYSVTIYNSLGQVVHEASNLQFDHYISCDNFKKGIYFYLIYQDTNNSKISGKLIID